MLVRLSFLLALAFAVVLCAPPFQQTVKYNTNAGPVEGKINVHLVSHSHDDVGWLKTVDQYYIGSNNSIQHAGVQYVLDSVVASLLKDKNRKFSFVETAFFARWMGEQTEEMKESVRELVKEKRLVFLNGGWCMHDEATAHYVDMVDQTTLGHKFLKKEFDFHPRVTWQIDPFGHSSTQASLLSAEVGFDSLFFARIDYQDFERRWANKSMEMLWRASPSLGVNSQVFTGVFADGYGPPDGFCFDMFCDDLPIQDDGKLYDVNVKERVDQFVGEMMEHSKHFRTNHIMLTMGSDFQYENANEWYKNLDKLIHYVNLDGRVNVFYSNPEIYTDAKHASNESWPVKTDDFFPYSDDEHSFWTGYFTSRPALKRYVRDVSGYLQSVRQLESGAAAIVKNIGKYNEEMEEKKKENGKIGGMTDKVMAAIGVANHHDGLTGTEKQHV